MSFFRWSVFKHNLHVLTKIPTVKITAYIFLGQCEHFLFLVHPICFEQSYRQVFNLAICTSLGGYAHLTKIRKSMKNCLMNTYDKVMLKKRAIIETVNDELKNLCQIEHIGHLSLNNCMSNLLSGLISYSSLLKNLP